MVLPTIRKKGSFSLVCKPLADEHVQDVALVKWNAKRDVVKQLTQGKERRHQGGHRGQSQTSLPDSPRNNSVSPYPRNSIEGLLIKMSVEGVWIYGVTLLKALRNQDLAWDACSSP